MTEDQIATDRRLWRRCLGYGLVGFGGPGVFAGLVLIRMVFIPGRSSHALAAFRFDHPAFIAAAILLVAGAALVIPGLRLIRS